MRTNTCCTLFNRYRPDQKSERWTRTYLDGVFWDETRATLLVKKGVAADCTAAVHIPCDVRAMGGGAYVPPGRFAGEGWTLSPGDYIVKGTVRCRPGDAHTMSMIARQEDALLITAVDHKDFGSHRLRHWVVTGK